MKAFLAKLGIWFFFLLLAGFLLLQGVGGMNKRLLKTYENNASFSTLLIGDSHIQEAIDDRQIGGIINMAEFGEAYLFSYAKIKTMLESHPQIKRVLLGCSYHNLSSSYDQLVFADDSLNISKRYFFLLPPLTQCRLIASNKINALRYLRKALKTGCNNLAAPPGIYSFTGGYNSMNKGMKTVVQDSSVKKRIGQQFFPGGQLAAVSRINLQYLEKIIALCRQKGVELILVKTPLAGSYMQKVPPFFKDQYTQLVNRPGIRLIDCNNLRLTDSCFLPDGDHVSLPGAIQTTGYVKTILAE